MQAVVADCMKAVIRFFLFFWPVHFDVKGFQCRAACFTDEIVALAGLKDFIRHGLRKSSRLSRVQETDIGLYVAPLARERQPVLWNLLTQTWDAPTHWQQLLDWTAEAFREAPACIPGAVRTV